MDRAAPKGGRKSEGVYGPLLVMIMVTYDESSKRRWSCKIRSVEVVGIEGVRK